MSFDPMAVAIDWLDAYRAGDIEAILDMYAEDAVVHCGCGGVKTISGREALRAYWLDRLRESGRHVERSQSLAGWDHYLVQH
ncbi:nuclear transport factor 2 family protein [Bradyrhizobium sp. LMG 9283]|uniref:nuclear transport factor 2 family protein n=1 Tax=Bradyrhizobium sp. LMG 9283 TaxID=592064 RepID=UPI00388DF647